MQLIGRDRILRTFMEGNCMLFELCSGNYQLGAGEDGKIVESIDEVQMFGKHTVQTPTGNKPLLEVIQSWLDKGGVNRARVEKRDLIMAEHAAKQPGTFDALIGQLNDATLAGQFHEMLVEAIAKKQVSAQAEVVAEVDGGILVKGEGGTKEFIPRDEDDRDDVLKRELALDTTTGAGSGNAGEPEADGGLSAQIAASTKAHTRAAAKANTRAAARTVGGKFAKERAA